MKKTVVITGASGLLGRQILREFGKDDIWKTVGLAYSRAREPMHKVDITNLEELKAVFKQYTPSVIIHSAAERRPDIVENKQEATHSLNVDATSNICMLAEQHNAVVVYISTDYVFDGKNAPYKETDDPNPLNKYGASKLEGERVVLNSNKDHIILRVPILYGPLEYLSESAVTTLFSSVKNTSTDAKINDVQRRFPTHTNDVALIIKDIVDKRVQGTMLTGIYHWSGDEDMTKYGMAIQMAEALNLPTRHIQPDRSDTGSTIRPYDSHLDPTKLEQLGISHRRSFKDGIKDSLLPFCKESE